MISDFLHQGASSRIQGEYRIPTTRQDNIRIRLFSSIGRGRYRVSSSLGDFWISIYRCVISEVVIDILVHTRDFKDKETIEEIEGRYEEIVVKSVGWYRLRICVRSTRDLALRNIRSSYWPRMAMNLLPFFVDSITSCSSRIFQIVKRWLKENRIILILAKKTCEKVGLKKVKKPERVVWHG